MKKILFLIIVTSLFCGKEMIYAQRVEMTVGKKIEVKELVNKKGKKTGVIQFIQNGENLKYVNMFKTLEGIKVCTENMKIARKHRNGVLVMTAVGLITIPLGYLILIGPIVSKKKKEIKYVKLAIEDYNKSLE